MLSSSQERQQSRMRRKTIKRLGNSDKKDQARKAAHHSADMIRRSTLLVNNNNTQAAAAAAASSLVAFPVIPSSASMGQSSVDSSQVSVRSEFSWEKAVKRGLVKGSSELNEVGSMAGGSTVFDMTIATDGLTEDATRASKMKRVFKRKKRGWKVKTASVASPYSSQSNSDGDAWMCGVCGRAFSSLEAADRHEHLHIHQVVAGLGWAGSSGSSIYNNSFMNTPSYGPGRRRFPSIGNGSLSQSEKGKDAAVARASFQNTSRKESAQHFVFGEELEEEKVPDMMDDRKPAALEVIQESPQHPVRSISPQFGADLPAGSLIPKPRARTNSEVRFDTAGPTFAGDDNLMGTQQEDTLLLSNSMRDYVVLADEALITVCERAELLILTQAEMDAERELMLLAKDKLYYDQIAERSLSFKRNPSNRFRTEGDDIRGKLQNKFLDAYQLMKEGDGKTMSDQYNRKKKGTDDFSRVISHTDSTLYVNVMVKNSVQVVRHELERLARKRWEQVEEADKFTRFERFRVYAHVNIVKLAGIALASDFTPRRIAVQLSNDLYRLLTPRLKRRGVTIETEIEYRVGPYFVLAVNIATIDWRRLIRATHHDVNIRKARWREENIHEDEGEQAKAVHKGFFRRQVEFFKRLFSMSQYDVLAQFLAWLYYVHWTIYLPICWISYYTVLGQFIRTFIISSVTDEIFFYVEEKGMEMEIEVRKAAKQAAFMLSALREIRADGRELKKKRQEISGEEKGSILGPLLGPAIKLDSGPAVPPPGFEVPDNLEFIGLELDLPVGFRRIRWAMLNPESDFIIEALYKEEAKYLDITTGEWSKHKEHVGAPKLPDSVNLEDLVGAEREGSYLMPKSAFVKAIMSYETQNLIAYNDYCFCIKKKALTPDAPYGSTFVAWTQYIFVDTGNDTCRLTCSVEAEFPNGPPLISRQIKSGMRAGTGELFVLLGETITKYADEYP